MKTKMFGIWTESVENFIQAVANLDSFKSKGMTHDELTAWMENEGAMLFQRGQAEYFERVKEYYLDENVGTKKLNVKFDYAYTQIEVGFNYIFSALGEECPELGQQGQALFMKLKEECLSEKHYPYIAARAVITEQMERRRKVQKENNIPENKLKNLETALEDFNFLIKASNASIDSINAFRPKLQVATANRATGSPLMYKTPSDSNTTEEPLRPTLSN